MKYLLNVTYYGIPLACVAGYVAERWELAGLGLFFWIGHVAFNYFKDK